MKKTIRAAVKAIIIQNEKLLVLKKSDEFGYFYTLPGGGVEHGENLEEAVTRECKEEISVKIKPGELLFIREYLAKNHEVEADKKIDLHQVEFMFRCRIIEGEIRNGEFPDNGQLSIEWLDISEIDKERLYPLAMRSYFKMYDSLEGVIYLGDVN
jgi:8-oxo-dGTP diphosphatase